MDFPVVKEVSLEPCNVPHHELHMSALPICQHSQWTYYIDVNKEEKQIRSWMFFSLSLGRDLPHLCVPEIEPHISGNPS